MTPQLRVLVIDDGVNNAEALGALIEAMGRATAIAFSGAQGIATASGFAPHLEIIDLEMPDMDGCEVARQLPASNPQGGTTSAAAL